MKETSCDKCRISMDPSSSKEQLKTIRELRSIRTFKRKHIPVEVLQAILQAGRNVPTAHNIQPWHFIVVSNCEIKKKLAKGRAGFIEDSALVIVGCGDPAESPEWFELEVAIAMQTMVLAAWVRGIGSCWIDIGSEVDVKQILQIPENIRVIALVAFGYPAKIPPSVWKKPLNQIIHYNVF